VNTADVNASVLFIVSAVKGGLRDVVDGRRQCHGRGRQRTATSLGRLAQTAEPPSRQPPVTERPPPTTGVASLSPEIDGKTSETDIGQRTDDDETTGNDDDDDDDDDDDESEEAQQQQHPVTDETQRTQKHNLVTDNSQPPSVSRLSLLHSANHFIFFMPGLF